MTDKTPDHVPEPERLADWSAADPAPTAAAGEPIQPLNTAPAPLAAAEVPAHGEADEIAPAGPEVKKRRFDLSKVNWKRAGILTAIGVATALILFLIVYNLAPVWWARLIGDFTQEDFGRAVLVGLIVGFGFTLVPLMVLLLLMYRSPVWLKIGLVVIAVLLAAPNLLTLWIQLDPTPATHAADRIMDTDAFGFSTSSAWGVGLGVVAFGFWAWLFVARRRNKKQIATLKASAADAGRSA